MTRSRHPARMPPLDEAWIPRPPELDHAPELALLAATRTALEIVVPVLLSANPELTTDWPPPDHAELHAARRILIDADRLRRAIDAYWAAVQARIDTSTVPTDEDDIPF